MIKSTSLQGSLSVEFSDVLDSQNNACSSEQENEKKKIKQIHFPVRLHHEKSLVDLIKKNHTLTLKSAILLSFLLSEEGKEIELELEIEKQSQIKLNNFTTTDISIAISYLIENSQIQALNKLYSLWL